MQVTEPSINLPAGNVLTRVKITMDTYGHLYEDASDSVANAMNAAFAAPVAPELTNMWAMRG